MAIDPVCGMSVDERSKLTVTRSKIKYYFCSTSCQEAFRSNPSKYLNKAYGTKADFQQETDHGHVHHSKEAEIKSDEKAKDPICGMVVNKFSEVGASWENLLFL
jgi:Cu+-exporting ATPase